MTPNPSDAPEFEEIEVGTILPPYQRTPTKVQLVMYAGAEDDYMPVHFDHHFAVEAGQPGVINHGWLTYAIALQSVTVWLPPSIARVVGSRSRYRRPTFPGHPIICHGRVTGVDADRRLVHVHVDAHDDRGEITTQVDATLEYLS